MFWFGELLVIKQWDEEIFKKSTVRLGIDFNPICHLVRSNKYISFNFQPKTLCSLQLVDCGSWLVVDSHSWPILKPIHPSSHRGLRNIHQWIQHWRNLLEIRVRLFQPFNLVHFTRWFVFMWDIAWMNPSPSLYIYTELISRGLFRTFADSRAVVSKTA